MPLVLTDLLGLLGYFLRAIGFLAVGWAFGRLVFERFNTLNWQLQIAYVLGLFGLLIALTVFSSAGSAGAFALGIAIAYFMVFTPMTKKEPPEPEKP